MNPIEALKREHRQIEMEILQIETVMEEDIINYSNLLHSFKKLCELWNNHEKKEEKIFAIMKKENIIVPVYTMTCEHKELRKHIEKIKQSINSGSENVMKKCFDEDLKEFINKIKKHKEDEDEILYTIALKEEFTEKEIEEMKKIIEEFDN
jgi:hemerythrin-like domain-containing protein